MSSSVSAPHSLTAEQIVEIQQTEIEALQSILDKDFRKIEQKAWKNAATTQLHEFDIVLRPDEEHLKPLVAVAVNIKLPKNYPFNPPTITIKQNDSRNLGLSYQQLIQLREALNAKARGLIGVEMVWELVSLGQEYISNNNQAPKDGNPSLSLEEEMKRRAQEEQQKQQELLQQETLRKKEAETVKSEQLAQLIEQEASKKALVLKQEKERKRVHTSHGRTDSTAAAYPGLERSSSTDRIVAPLDSHRIETFLEPIEQNGRVTSVLRIGPVLYTTPLSIRYLAESAHDDPSDSIAHNSLILEHFFISSQHYAYSIGKRKVEEVESELDKLAKIREPGLVNVLASAVTRVSDNQGWKLSVVLERCDCLRLDTLLDQVDSLPWKRVRSYLLSLLKTVQVLHNRNLLHRSIDSQAIYIESTKGFTKTSSTDAKPSVRLADACYMRKLRDMHRSNPINEIAGELPVEVKFNPWRPPESIEHPLTYTRKRDLWDLGVCACQMLFGLECYLEFDTPEQLIRSSSGIASHVEAFLMLMLERSPKKRPSITSIISRLEEIILFEDQELSQGSNTQIPSAPKEGVTPGRPNFPTAQKKTESLAEKPFQDLATSTMPPLGLQGRPGSFWPLRYPSIHLSPNGVGVSRYLSDFEEVEFLGKGAFGSVVKAKNRLDGRFYAVKKIKLSSSADEDERTMREIAALSRLDHPHIVRYTTCWIEETHIPLSGLVGSDTDGVTHSESLETHTTSKTHPSLSKLSSVRKLDKADGRDESFRAVPDFDSDYLSVGHDPFSRSNSLADIRFANDEDSDEEESMMEKEKSSHFGTTSALFRRPTDNDSSSSNSDSDSDSTSDEDENGAHDDDFSRMPVSSRRESKAGLSVSKKRDGHSLANSTTYLPMQRVLYIQMEFVENRTLREAIEKGLSEDEAWRILRQMVEALIHISSLGIIHRDLKPSNVLMYGSGDVKVGDFGLATNAHQVTDAFGVAAPGTADLAESTDMTGELGTFLYTAPELRSKKGAKYNFKVDIYSLGIIFFEMLASQIVYKTGMERILLIRELRTPSVTFPAQWPFTKYEKQTTLIRLMLDHDPDRRPSPLDILKSDLLPPKMEDEYIEECLRLMANPSSVYNHQLMDALFSRTANDLVRDFTFDTGSETDQDNALISAVCDLIRSVCRKHGAVEFSPPLLVPPNGLYAANEKLVQMLDKTGKVVQLPYDLTVPFARVFARSDNQRFKRFEISHVYRENVVAGGQPRAVLASSFDIISPEKSAAAEAEALAWVDDILDEIPGVASENWVIHINHESILSLILERVPSKHRATVIGVVGLLAGSKTIQSARTQLLQLGLQRSIIEELESFNLSDELDTVHRRLERLFPLDHRQRLSKAVAEIAEVIETAQHFGVQRKFLFTPLLAQSSRLYKGGIIFTIGKAGKRRDVVAAGGRYDALLKRFSSPSPTSSAPLHGVGVQIAVGKVTLGLAKYQEQQVPRLLSRAEEERSFGLFTPRRCDVYVASAPGLFKTRMEVCRELWAHNISADLQYEHATYDSPESAAETCRSEGILLLVFVKARSPVLKVKMVLQRAEYEVPRHELVAFVQDRLSRQRSIDIQLAGHGGGPSASTKLHTSAADVGIGRSGSLLSSLSATGAPLTHHHHFQSPLRACPSGDLMSSLMINVREREMVLPERPIERSKKGDKNNQNRPKPSSRQLVLDKASRQVSKFAEQLQAGGIPILAVDFTGANFDKLAAALMACLGSHVSWTSGSGNGASGGSGSGGLGSGLASSSGGSGSGGGGAVSGRTNTDDDGATIFRAFLEGLSAEEKDYAKLIKRKAIEFAFSTSNNNTFAVGCGRVFLYSLREDRTALVGAGR